MNNKKEKEWQPCSFPDCGCPEARLCMSGDPNGAALFLNRPPSPERAREMAMEREARRLGMTLDGYKMTKYGTTYVTDKTKRI